MNDFPSSRACRGRLAMLALALTAGCSSVSLRDPQHASRIGGPLAARPAGTVIVAEQLTGAERTFMTQAVNRAAYELEVSRLAAERAIDPRVRAYAQTVAHRSAQASNELGALMRAKGVARPSGLTADKATKLQRLAALRPSPNFDLGYARVVGVEDHQATIAMYERARRETRDRELKAWIDKTLPVLRNHLAAAQNLAGQLAG